MLLKITLYIVVIGIVLILVRIVKGPTVWDRLMSLNLISAKILILLTVYGVYKNNILLLDISISYAIIGFLGIVLICRFISQGGRLK